MKADFLIDNFNRWDGISKIKKKSLIEKNFHIYYEINIDNVDNGKLRGFSNFDLEGKVINEKNKIQYEMISETYLKPKFYTNCVAGSIFGVVTSDGNVLPCEILDNDKALGNLKDYDFDFMKLWNDTKANETRKWIKDTKCNCHWECIFTYNLISSPKYVASMATKILKSK